MHGHLFWTRLAQGWRQGVLTQFSSTRSLGPCSILDQVGLRCYPPDCGPAIAGHIVGGGSGETQCERGQGLRMASTTQWEDFLEDGALEL